MNALKQFCRETAVETVGSALIAVGIYNFAAASAFPMTGFSGIALILYRLFHLPIGFTSVVLNVPVAIICYRLLGRKFFFRSLRCILISSFIIDYAAPLLPVYQGSRMLSALCTGVLAGLGYALIYTRNSSTGGTDFIIMAVKAVKPYIPLGRIAFLSDVGIILAGGILFKDIDGIIYGMLINFIFAVVADKAVYGINAGKFALIITESSGQAIADAIDACCGRGSTILHGQGGYQGSPKELVLVACDNKQMYFVQQTVKDIDPWAFTVILESNEVHGEGFAPFSIGEKR